mgnify:CR=1 FL=1
MDGKQYSYRLFSRSDFSAFWALFTDNLINLIVLAGVCQFVFNMPAAIVFGRILPGAAVAIMAGVAVYAWLAKRAAARAGRDFTALPYGISTPVMFVYLFGVIGPIYWATNDPLLAWQVGIGAGFIGGIVAALGAIIAMSIWQAVGFHMVIWLSGLQTISPTLYEAAAIEAAAIQQHAQEAQIVRGRAGEPGAAGEDEEGELEALEAALAEALAANRPLDWHQVMDPLHRLGERLRWSWGVVSHLNGVCNSPELREAHASQQSAVVAGAGHLNTSEPTYTSWSGTRRTNSSMSAGFRPARLPPMAT